jgi:hypothetical protein
MANEIFHPGSQSLLTCTSVVAPTAIYWSRGPRPSQIIYARSWLLSNPSPPHALDQVPATACPPPMHRAVADQPSKTMGSSSSNIKKGWSFTLSLSLRMCSFLMSISLSTQYMGLFGCGTHRKVRRRGSRKLIVKNDRHQSVAEIVKDWWKGGSWHTKNGYYAQTKQGNPMKHVKLPLSTDNPMSINI